MAMSQILYLLFLCYSIFINSNAQNPCPKLECNGVKIEYPFWQRDETTSEQFCGYPGFGLSCLDRTENPVLNLQKDNYSVRDIDYDTYTLNVVDIDIIGQPCPRVRHNFTVETLPLYLNTDFNLNLTFYFNCSSSSATPPLLSTPISCLASGENQNQSYVVETTIEPTGSDRWFEFCKDRVDVAVKKSEIQKNNYGFISEFHGALNEGFLLDWKTLTDCKNCEESDGRCGFNNTAKEFLCFCENNTTRKNNQSCRSVPPHY